MRFRSVVEEDVNDPFYRLDHDIFIKLLKMTDLPLAVSKRWRWGVEELLWAKLREVGNVPRGATVEEVTSITIDEFLKADGPGVAYLAAALRLLPNLKRMRTSTATRCTWRHTMTKGARVTMTKGPRLTCFTCVMWG